MTHKRCSKWNHSGCRYRVRIQTSYCRSDLSIAVHEEMLTWLGWVSQHFCSWSVNFIWRAMPSESESVILCWAAICLGKLGKERCLNTAYSRQRSRHLTLWQPNSENRCVKGLFLHHCLMQRALLWEVGELGSGPKEFGIDISRLPGEHPNPWLLCSMRWGSSVSSLLNLAAVHESMQNTGGMRQNKQGGVWPCGMYVRALLRTPRSRSSSSCYIGTLSLTSNTQVPETESRSQDFITHRISSKQQANRVEFGLDPRWFIRSGGNACVQSYVYNFLPLSL